MSLIFADGFDHYGVITDKWDYPGQSCAIRQGTGAARTGIGCLEVISGAFGPIKVIPRTRHILTATNWWSSGPGSVFWYGNQQAGGLPTFGSLGNARCMSVDVLANGDVAVYGGPSNVFIGQANIPGLVTFNQYNSIAMAVYADIAVGTVKVWVNGALVLDLTGCNTVWGSIPTYSYYDAVEILGPPGTGFTCYHDDVYFLDLATPPNDSFLGALRIYAMPPTADGAVAFTPLVAPNWSEVNEIPPDGDTSYVSSPTPGDTDQYVYPLAGPPPASSLLFVEHDLDMGVDSGTRAAGSVLNGTAVEGVHFLANGYHIFGTPYDVNPSTGLAFAAADFPLLAGPQVTA